MEYYPVTKKNEIMSLTATRMDLESVIFSEVSKSETEGEISYGIPNMWNLKRNDFNELTFKIETEFETLRMNLWLPGRKDGRKG